MNYLKSFALSALFLLTGTSALEAQTVSPDAAMSKAKAFMNKSRKAKSQNVNAQSLELAYTSKAGDETYYYVFNNSQNGYIIIGGDEVTQDVLGYSDSGTFDYDKLPENMKWFLSCYDKEISSAIKQVKQGKLSAYDVAQAKRRAARKAPKANIDYLVQTKWDQIAPFNCMHPYNKEENCILDDEYGVATGCVATAGAQIMKYHEWPDTGVGSRTGTYKFEGYTPSANFGETTYEWDKMKDEYEYWEYSGDAADIAVGTLMYHVGVAVNMKYNSFDNGGSGADARDLATALVTYFKYSKGITYHERAYYSDEQWEDMVYDELAASRPVLYGGQQESGSGHAFVCDGYENGLYHINWGWSGYCDAYFLLTPTAGSGTALCPEGSGSGGGEAGEGYYMSQHIGIGITPDYDGTSQPAKSAFTRGITLVTTSTTPGGNITIDGYYCGNGSVVPQAYNLKVKYTNTDDESEVIIGSYVRTTSEIYPGYSTGSDEPFTTPLSLEPGKSYYVSMMYENSDGEYVDMPQPQNWEPQVLSITEPTDITLSKELVVDNGGYMSQNNGEIHFSLKNYKTEPYLIGTLVIYALELVDNNYRTIGMWGFKNENFEVGEEKDYSLSWLDLKSGNNSFVEGKDYYIVVHDGNTRNNLSPYVPLYFRADKPIDYTLTSAEWGTLCLPYTAEVPAGLTAYTVTGTDGNKLVKEEVSTLEMNKPYLVTGTPDTYSFAGPETPEAENLKNGLLVGNTTADQTYAPQGSYVLQNLEAVDGLAFYEVENNGNQRVRQYGAYLKTNSSTSTASFKFSDDETTGISTVKQNESETPAYNLNGIRVDRNAKGIVIINGKVIYNK